MNNRPLLIVLTPVRNEAWILHAFLKATSLWADHIIIADQMSTDGSRDIYPQYEKVILVDNPRKEMHQARTRQLLFDAAKKIEGDKILFTLDADEFLSGNFMSTEGWKIILESEPGDVFNFRWMNLQSDCKTYTSYLPYYWAFHLNDNYDGYFPDRYIHEWRLPWPKNLHKEYIIEDISFLHFARVNVKRQINKEIFYQVSTVANERKYSGVSMFRAYSKYHPIMTKEIYELPYDVYTFYGKNGLNILNEIDRDEIGSHYIEEILSCFKSRGEKKFRKLDIWDAEFVKQYNVVNPQTFVDKIIIKYLRATKKISKRLSIRIIDWVLKKVY